MDCSNCGSNISTHERNCSACGEDCGYPNVRLAVQAEEFEALAERVRRAHVSADARNSRARLDAFEAVVEDSKAVVARPAAEVSRLLSDEDESYASFQQLIAAGTRRPRENQFDQVRLQYENALFPNFSEQIVFAALTLDGRGLSGYGACSIVLKEKFIEKRASVFEENPHTFAKRHGVLLNQPIPPGFRAVWCQRGQLAVAKLHAKINYSTKDSEFGSVLVSDDGTTASSDFIEVHIYGAFNRNSILKLIGSRPKDRTERLIWDAMCAFAKQAGIEVADQ